MATDKNWLHKAAFEKCARITTKICKGKETRLLWELEDWKTSRQVYKSAASCTLKLDELSLSFSFREVICKKKEREGKSWLSLQVCGPSLPSPNDGAVAVAEPSFFRVEVNSLNEKLELDNFVYSTKATIAVSTDQPILLEKYFIRLDDGSPDHGANESFLTTPLKHPKCLRLVITVTELYTTSNLTPRKKVELAATTESNMSQIIHEDIAPSPAPPAAVVLSPPKVQDSKPAEHTPQLSKDTQIAGWDWVNAETGEFEPLVDTGDVMQTRATSSPKDERATHTTGTNGQKVELTCQWRDCGLEFCSLDEISKHIRAEHVQEGTHICKWKECFREEKPYKATYMLVVHISNQHMDIMYNTRKNAELRERAKNFGK